MKRSHRSAVVCLGVLVLGVIVLVAPGRPEETPNEVAVGTTSLRRSTDFVSEALKQFPDRFSRQVQETAPQDLAQYGARVMSDYDVLSVPLEVTITQSMLLAADRLSGENPQLMGIVQQRITTVFGLTADQQEQLHAQKLAWSEVILALALAKATGKEANDLVAQAKANKSWAEIAQGAGLKKEELRKVLAPLWRQQQ